MGSQPVGPIVPIAHAGVSLAVRIAMTGNSPNRPAKATRVKGGSDFVWPEDGIAVTPTGDEPGPGDVAGPGDELEPQAAAAMDATSSQTALGRELRPCGGL
jgi:hypothetical protein